jgi:hypothetical protein
LWTHNTTTAQNTPSPASLVHCVLSAAPASTQQTTEDEQSRDEKIKRASFEIKTAHVSSPIGSRKLPRLSPAATAATAAVPAGSAPQLGDSATDFRHQGFIGDQQEQQQQQQGDTGAAQQQGDVAPQLDAQQQQQLVLSPQEVLQELLGDMYIDQSRLTMGEATTTALRVDQHQMPKTSAYHQPSVWTSPLPQLTVCLPL